MMRDLGLLMLRSAAGAVLVGHGYTKLFGGPGREAPEPLAKVYGEKFEEAVQQAGPHQFAHALREMDTPVPHLAAYASGAAEFGGGIGLALDFKTRASALAVLFNMATAIRKVHWDKGLYGEGGSEFPLLLAAVAAALLFTGPGKLSVDRARHAAGTP